MRQIAPGTALCTNAYDRVPGVLCDVQGALDLNRAFLANACLTTSFDHCTPIIEGSLLVRKREHVGSKVNLISER